MKKSVLIAVVGDTGNEPEAIRQVLEQFGFFVAIKYIGRPNDFISVLENDITDFNYDFLIISCHGEDGTIVMPVLSDEVYTKNEPKGNFSAEIISLHINIKNKIIVNLGCTTGRKELSDVFSKQNTYIAPLDYAESKSSLFFVVKFFYEISQNNCSIMEAFNSSKKSDDETNMFVYKGELEIDNVY